LGGFIGKDWGITNEQIEIAEKNGICLDTLKKRIYSRWDIQKAITKPTQRTAYRGSWDKKIFALYKGDNLIADGTVFEIAEKTGKTVKAIQGLTYPSYMKKVKALEWKDCQVMEYLGEEGEEDES